MNEEEKITKKIWTLAILAGAFIGIAIAAVFLFFYLPTYIIWLAQYQK